MCIVQFKTVHSFMVHTYIKQSVHFLTTLLLYSFLTSTQLLHCQGKFYVVPFCIVY